MNRPDRVFVTGRAEDPKTTSRAYEGVRMPPKPPRPADYRLPVGANPRPNGDWMLVDYSWDERTGIGRLSYRHRKNRDERLVVELQQPASSAQEGWSERPEIDREAVLARYFESQRTQMVMQAAGVYGR